MAEENALVPELSAFERIKHRDEDGAEYWYARELMKLLGYTKWQNFERVIEEAIAVVGQEGPDAVASNFTATSKVSLNGKNTYRDYQLTRHACYVIAESADGRKDEVAWAKIYFAYTTERYELLAQSEEDALRIEERQKLLLRNAELQMRVRIAGGMTHASSRPSLIEAIRGCITGRRRKTFPSARGCPRAPKSWTGWAASRARPTACVRR